MDADARLRRELLKTIVALTGCPLVGLSASLPANAFMPGQQAGRLSQGYFSADELRLLEEMADTLIPDTETPGAKASGIGSFMQAVVTDCYEDHHKSVLRAGLARMQKIRHGGRVTSFVKFEPAQREEILERLSQEADRYAAWHNGADASIHFYNLIRQLTLWGFFTSPLGLQVLRHEPVPGRYDGNYPYRPGEAAFSDNMKASLFWRKSVAQ